MVITYLLRLYLPEMGTISRIANRLELELAPKICSCLSCAVNSLSSDDRHDQVSPLHSVRCCISYICQIHSSCFMYHVHPPFSWTPLLSDSLFTRQHHFFLQDRKSTCLNSSHVAL